MKYLIMKHRLTIFILYIYVFTVTILISLWPQQDIWQTDLGLFSYPLILIVILFLTRLFQLTKKYQKQLQISHLLQFIYSGMFGIVSLFTPVEHVIGQRPVRSFDSITSRFIPRHFTAEPFNVIHHQIAKPKITEMNALWFKTGGR